MMPEYFLNFNIRYNAFCDGFWRRTIIHQFTDWSYNGDPCMTWFSFLCGLVVIKRIRHRTHVVIGSSGNDDFGL